MKPEPLANTQPRTKIEFMYRDLLVEYERLSKENAAQTASLKEVSIALLGLPALLKETAASVSNEGGKVANQQIQIAAHAINRAETDLQSIGKRLLRDGYKNLWVTLYLAALSGLLGALVGTLSILYLNG